MTAKPDDVFVIIRWPADAGLPRYTFATGPHAAEIQVPIERIQTCASLESAIAITERLNAGRDAQDAPA
ncbi:MAG: hypothetical protein DMF87_06700 [Acidobacteria bacterium]|nr:MAG: hypothetical protein DMF88_12960 [Acidobacteriota bacterium]PYR81072.1 MAG: hypothetical protein DMF87_06700 [Acidobacteriota bacterium]